MVQHFGHYFALPLTITIFTFPLGDVVAEDKGDIPLILRVRAAIATALGAAAARSKLLADQEEREMEYLLAIMIETQVTII